MQLSIPVRALAAALLFIDPKNHRPHLRGAWYGPHGESAALVASDGMSLVVVRLPGVAAPSKAVTLPHGLVAAAAKLKAFDAEVLAPEEGPLRLDVGDGVRYFPRIADPFVDWRRVVPNGVSGEPAAFENGVLRPLHKLAKLFPSTGVRIFPNGEGPAVFEVVGELISGVTMPFRSQSEPDAAGAIEAMRG